jgi:DNA polymerase III alpha subunit
MNEDGYRNLMKLASVAQTAGFYYKPRIDRKLLEGVNPNKLTPKQAQELLFMRWWRRQ